MPGQCSGWIEVGLAGSNTSGSGSGLRLLRFRLSVRARDGPRVSAVIGDALLAATIISGTLRDTASSSFISFVPTDTVVVVFYCGGPPEVPARVQV